MSGPVTYRRDESIAVITMDDGKVNALGPTMQQALNEALDNADRDDVGAVVIAALEFTKLDLGAHAASKLRARADALKELRAGIDAVPAELVVQ